MRVASFLGIGLMRCLGQLPLAWVRALGFLFGHLLYALAGSRRKVVLINLRLCFAHLTESQRTALARQHFVYFAKAWLDRGWLWHGSAHTTLARLRLTGTPEALAALQGDDAIVIFAPHFVGLDAGWTALTQQIPRNFSTIYSHQTNRQVDAWVLAGRGRFGQPSPAQAVQLNSGLNQNQNLTELFDRHDGPKVLVAALRKGGLLYLLPDMNYDPKDSLFLPFYGEPAATVTSLPRLAKLGRAKVVPVVTRMTVRGYEIEVLPAWPDYPSLDVEADTLAMNQRLETYINTMPAQYYWVHKRFKDRPAGLRAPY